VWAIAIMNHYSPTLLKNKSKKAKPSWLLVMVKNYMFV
jgi:hypothetical protein